MQTFDRLKEELCHYAKKIKETRMSGKQRFRISTWTDTSLLLVSFISWSASRQWPFYNKSWRSWRLLEEDHNLSLGLSEAAKLPKVTTVGLTKIDLEASKLRCDVFQNLFVCNSLLCEIMIYNKLKFHDLTNFSISDPVPAIFPPWFWRNVALRSPAAKPHSGALPRTSPVHQDRSRNTKRWSKVENTSSI